MKNLLYGAFTTLVMFGLGKAIYDQGKKDGVKNLQNQFEAMTMGMKIQEQKNKESE